MHVILPIAVALFILRCLRGVTDTMEKYEKTGLQGEFRPKTGAYLRGLE